MSGRAYNDVLGSENITLRQSGHLNRTALVRDPYGWWRKRRGVERLPLIPIGPQASGHD